MPILRKSGFQSIRPPTPQISRPLAARRGPGMQVFFDRLLEPDVDVEQAAAAARCRVAAFERQLALLAASSVTYSTGYLMSRSSSAATLK